MFLFRPRKHYVEQVLHCIQSCFRELNMLFHNEIPFKFEIQIKTIIMTLIVIIVNIFKLNVIIYFITFFNFYIYLNCSIIMNLQLHKSVCNQQIHEVNRLRCIFIIIFISYLTAVSTDERCQLIENRIFLQLLLYMITQAYRMLLTVYSQITFILLIGASN